MGVRAGVFTGGGGERKKPGPPGRTLELGWVGLLGFFFFLLKDVNPTPASLQPVPVAGRGARTVGALSERPLWTFGAGLGSSVMLTFGGPE